MEMGAEQAILISADCFLLFAAGRLLPRLLLFWAVCHSSYNGGNQPDPRLQVGLLQLPGKHLAQRPRHLPFSGPDRVAHFLSPRHFHTLTLTPTPGGADAQGHPS